jgi:hypothetical protein
LIFKVKHDEISGGKTTMKILKKEITIRLSSPPDEV